MHLQISNSGQTHSCHGVHKNQDATPGCHWPKLYFATLDNAIFGFAEIIITIMLTHICNKYIPITSTNNLYQQTQMSHACIAILWTPNNPIRDSLLGATALRSRLQIHCRGWKTHRQCHHQEPYLPHALPGHCWCLCQGLHTACSTPHHTITNK